MRSWVVLAVRLAAWAVSPVGTLAYFAGRRLRWVPRAAIAAAFVIWLVGVRPQLPEVVEVRAALRIATAEAASFVVVQEAATKVLTTDVKTVAPMALTIGGITARRPRRRHASVSTDAIDIGMVRGGGLPHFRTASRLVLRPNELRRHLVVIGSTGSGKTTTTMHLAAGAAKLGWTVIYIDAKGDHDNARSFYGSCIDAGVGKDQIAGWPYAAWDAWRGSVRDIANRVLASQDFTEPYYRETARLAVGLATGGPGSEPPGSSAEFIERLTDTAIKRTWKGDSIARQWLDLDAKTRHGTALRFSGFFSAVGTQLDGDVGFEDCTAAYFALDAVSLKDDAEAVGRLLLEDLAHWAARRKPTAEPVLLVVDEFSAITTSSNQVAGLIERLRGFNVAVVLASQSVHGLGDEAERILDACGTLLLHQSSNPELLTNRAGTFSTAEPTFQIHEGGPTGMGSMRVNDQFKVSPNEVRRLEVGECVVVHHGDYVRATIDPPVRSSVTAPGTWRAAMAVAKPQVEEAEPSVDMSELEL